MYADFPMISRESALSQTFVVHISGDLSHVRSLQKLLRLRQQGVCLGSWLPKGYQEGIAGSKAIDFYAFS